jgi:hypothetical protein
MNSNKDDIRTMIELSDADKIIEDFANIKELPQKLGYIMGIFDVSVVGRRSGAATGKNTIISQCYRLLLIRSGDSGCPRMKLNEKRKR